MKRITTVIIGAGQSGLAFSQRLSERSIDHVILERGEVANSWSKERWDSLRLLTPNWQSRLPGYKYDGDDPDGYMNMSQVVNFFQEYAKFTAAPVVERTTVNSVYHDGVGYVVSTNRGDWHCAKVVLANGACNIANVPSISDSLPASVNSITPMQYKSPAQLDAGGVMVVGASASGVQFAKEIQESGRQVTMCVGEHVRLPRMYRGRDIKWWMDITGTMDVQYNEVDDISRARRVPSLQLVGTKERISLDINILANLGVNIVGRLAGMRDGKAQFSGSLNNQCVLADLKMNRMLDTIDNWVRDHAKDSETEAKHRFEPTKVNENPALTMDLTQRNIKTVIWATGYRADYSWLKVPVFDHKGRIRHDGGIVDAPGMYVMGLPFLRKRKSSFIDGAADDARDLANHMCASLQRAAA
jgi:putative flavoprotein involved in K+ transport